MPNIFHVHRVNDTITLGQSGTVITCNPLTTSRLMASGASKELVSSDLVNWVAGTSNQITVTDDADGTITLSIPQNIHTGASPTFANLTISSHIYGIDSSNYYAAAIDISSNPSQLIIQSQTAKEETGLDGGLLQITAGAGDPPGVGGKVSILSGGTYNAVLDTTLLTVADKTFAFPDISGTLIVTGATPTFAGLFITNIKSGATQAAAGAAANELWKTSGHATLPDNVLMIGV